MMYSFEEITLLPKEISEVNSRKGVNPFDKNGKLPIFVAPMTCLLDKNNFKTFLNSKVTPIYPVFNGESVEQRLEYSNNTWIAVSLKEFEEYFVTNPLPIKNTPYKILMDCAQGQLNKIFVLAKAAKEHYGTNIVIMAGNIANPATYYRYCQSGIDYVRVGIGGGSGCLSSVLTGIHASLPYLLQSILKIKKKILEECAEGKGKQYSCITKVIADGGINKYSRIMKALALGADYVMMGSIFASCKEARSQGTYYGQASEQGQLDRFGKVLNEPEGCSRTYTAITTLSELSKKIEDILRSTMSYAGCFSLKDFIGKVETDMQSINEYNSYNK